MSPSWASSFVKNSTTLMGTSHLALPSSPFFLLPYLHFLFLLLISLTLLWRYLLRRLPGHGPPTYPLLGCLISFYKNRRRLLDWYTELLAESPTQTIVVTRLGARRTVVTANPDNIECILKTRFHNFPKGKPFTDILGDFLGRGIFNVDGELWQTQRKLASHEFSTRSLRDYVVKTLEKEIGRSLLLVLDSACTGGRVVDLQDVLRRFAFDTVCKISLGVNPINHPMSSSAVPGMSLPEAFDTASEISARRAASPLHAMWKVKRALSVGSEKRLKESVRHIHGSVTKLIRNKKDVREARRDDDDDKLDLSSRLIAGGHNDEVIRDMLVSFIMAGRDTTSAALTWFFWLLSCHPQIEKQVVKEVATAVDSEEGKKLSYESLEKMKFLKACLCESMRLYPPVAWDSKHAADDDVLPDGTRVGRGDRVTYFPYGVGRMEKVWGKGWAVFRPTRWMEPDGSGQLVKVSPYKFPVFQAGPRVCLGKDMAFIQMKYVAASILSMFEIRRVSSRMPVFVPLLTAHMAGGLEVMVQRRGLASS